MRTALDQDLATDQPRMPQQPLLVAMCGLPGTGKSYFAAKLTEQVPFLILETDRLRKVLIEHPKYTPGEHRRVFRSCYQLIQYYLINGYSVLFDATNLNEEFRTYLYDLAEATTAPLAGIHATPPTRPARRRLHHRGAWDPDRLTRRRWRDSALGRQAAGPERFGRRVGRRRVHQLAVLVQRDLESDEAGRRR